jgi:hypothetical protein
MDSGMHPGMLLHRLCGWYTHPSSIDCLWNLHSNRHYLCRLWAARWKVVPRSVRVIWTMLTASLRTHDAFTGKCKKTQARHINPLTPELIPSAQRCLTRIFTRNFASWTVQFINICVNNQQTQQLFTQFINYVWNVLHVSASHCHLQGAFLMPSERYSIDKQSIEYCGWACCV